MIYILINLLEKFRLFGHYDELENQDDGTRYDISEEERLLNKAQEIYEDAAMWAVKAVTKHL